MDTLLGGGIERGTSTLIVGAAGTGQIDPRGPVRHPPRARGESAALFMFDERPQHPAEPCRRRGHRSAAARSAEGGRNHPASRPRRAVAGRDSCHAIRRAVEQDGAAIVVIDSLNGYLNAMPGERFLIIQLHELLTYLGQAGVATI